MSPHVGVVLASAPSRPAAREVQRAAPGGRPVVSTVRFLRALAPSHARPVAWPRPTTCHTLAATLAGRLASRRVA